MSFEKLKRFFTSRYMRLGFGVSLGGLAIMGVGSQVDMAEVWQILPTASPGYLLLGIISVCANLVAKIMRWRVLMGQPGRRVSDGTLVGVMLSGQLLNAFIPGRVGDFVRIFVAGQTAGKVFVVGTIALEKWLDTLAFAFLFLLALLWGPSPTWLEESVPGLLTLMLLGSIGLIGAVYFVEPLKTVVLKIVGSLPARGRFWVAPRIEAGFNSLLTLREMRAWVWVVVWTMFIWGTAVLNNYVSMRALRVDLPISAAIVLLIGLQIGIVAVASPGAIGIFEYVCLLTLTFFGVEQTQALSVGLLLHGLVYLPLVLGGFWPLIRWGIPLPINGSEG